MRSGQVRESQYVKISKSIDGPGICGANTPLKVAALASPVAPDYAQSGNLILTSGNLMLTSITPTATLACPMVSAVDSWLGNDIQTAAMTWFGQPVVELVTAGSFGCRPMNHRAGARLSEHSFANALDLKAVRLADGRTVSVAKGWRGAGDEQGFLREITHLACKRFTTVLAPGSDALHYDHIHIDLARHNARGDRHVCRPDVPMPPPPGSQPQIAQSPVMKPAPATDSQDGEIEDLRSEPNFSGRYFDVTGSVRSPDDPPVLKQHPGVDRRKPR
ncbi:MAG TPA: extensin family protein, partial [Beijerinckiaceae bacterium]|nr:extensin family protein [Beijerinckiaceae bacterium]